jgi:hypothetical protein
MHLQVEEIGATDQRHEGEEGDHDLPALSPASGGAVDLVAASG